MPQTGIELVIVQFKLSPKLRYPAQTLALHVPVCWITIRILRPKSGQIQHDTTRNATRKMRAAN